WINLRVETVRTLADAVAGFELARKGVTVLSRAQALALVERACDTALHRNSYFGAIADRPGLHRAVQRALDDLRLAGALIDRIPDWTFENPRKAEDLARIFTAYGEEMVRGVFVDRVGVLERAVEILKAGGRGPYDEKAIWVVLEDRHRGQTEVDFLRLVAGEPGTASATAYGIEFPADGETGATGADVCVNLRNVEAIFVRASGEENEIRGALRAVLSEGIAFDDVEMLYTDRDGYLARSFELTSELNVPATFAEGIAASFTRTGMAVLGFLSWVGGGFEASAIQKIALAGALKLSQFAPPESRVSPQAIVRILRESAIGWGRDRYIPRLDALLAEQERALGDPELHEARRRGLIRDRNAALATQKLCAKLLQLAAPFDDAGDIEVSSLAAAAAEFIEEVAASRNEIDGMARQALLRMLRELAALPSREIKRAEATDRLRDAVLHLHVAASNPRPGHLHVAPIRLGGWSGRHRIFVLGLDDSRHPGRGAQDPVLLDSERVAMNGVIDPGKLTLTSDRPSRRREEFFSMLTRCGGFGDQRRMTFSYSSLELLHERDGFPSSTMLDIYRETSGDRQATYEALLAAMGERPVGFVPETVPLNESEWWFSETFTRARPSVLGQIEKAYRWLGDGRNAEEARDSEDFTKWDGRIEAPPDRLDPRLSEKVFSASRLERLAGCPYRYFLQYLLRIEPLETLDREPETWLSPRDFGSLLHEVLQEFMEVICAQGEKASLARHRKRIEAVAVEALGRWRITVPPPNESAFEHQREDLFDACEVFLRTEELECGAITPMFFEVPFGESDSTLPDFAITLGVDRRIRLRGRIDRVDSDDNEPLWDVWDYKSGSTWKYERGGRLARGTRIQHAIYARAVEAMLAARGAGESLRRSGYYFPTRKGGGRRNAVSTDADELRHVLNLLCDVAGSGTFVHGLADECTFCDYAQICGGGPLAAARSERKLQQGSENRGLEAWLKLQEID
ncbi:MAG: PD-(D/E)XK nuclease family protein, partial [Acidobacteriota bacterium]